MKRAFAVSDHSGQRRKRRLSRQTEGSVSVFLIMVLAFVFLFVTVLIDYARIAAVNVQGERLARAGVRSVMSAYDIELRESYGLFASGESDENMLLSRVLNDNLHKSGRADAFNLLPMGLDSSTVDLSRPLGDYDIFRRQIMEEMKYKAPVDFSLELAGKFKPLSAAMSEASRATVVLGKLQPLYDKREEALDVMLERRRQAAASGRPLLQLIMNPPGDSISSSSLGNVSTAADIAAQYGDYVGKYEADLNRGSRQPARYTYQLALYSQQSAAVISQLPVSMAAFREAHNRLLEESRLALNKAKELNEEMKSVLEQSRISGADGHDPAGDWDIPGSQEGMDSGPLRKLREQEDSLILPSTDIAGMENNLSAQERAFQALEPEVAVLPEILAEISGLYADGSRMVAAVLEATRTANAYLNNYGEGGVIISSESAAIEEHRSSDKQRRQLEQQAKTKLGEAMKMVDKIRELSDAAGESMERYDTLRQYYEDSLSFNKGLDQAGEEVQRASDPYAAGSSAMVNMDGIYDTMGSLLTGARDRLFQTEYSALYFQHFDVSALTSLAPDSGGGAGGDGGQLVAQLDPHAQELEYILYGFHNPAGNVAAAYGEIFAMRLAIRTMEGFIEKASLGNPLAVLAAALLYGIEQAVLDMLKLCKEDSIPLSKYMPAQLTYRDHLRLFMMLHGGGEVQLSRMLALIRLNTGINPAEKDTYASAEIRLGLRLWFLPGVIKLLDYSGALAGEVEGNIYYKAVQADFAY